jgi:Spy/CpxP family protein refolding chaperone
MAWEIVLGVVAVKGAALFVLWFNRRRVASRFITSTRLDMEQLSRHIGRELDLTCDEKDRLALWLEEYERTVDDLRSHNKELRSRLLEEMSAPSLDRVRINDLYADKRLLVEHAFVHFREKLLAFHALLTPTQRSKLASLISRNADHPVFSHPLLP